MNSSRLALLAVFGLILLLGLLYVVFEDDAGRSDPLESPDEHRATGSTSAPEKEPQSTPTPQSSLEQREAVKHLAATEDPTPSGEVFFGRVLDAARHPVPRAHIAFYVDGQGIYRGTANESGRFEIQGPTREVGRAIEGGVLAWNDQHQAGVKHCSLWSTTASTASSPESDSNLGDVILTPGQPLKVQVVQEQKGVADAEVVLEVGRHRIRVALDNTDVEGWASFPAVPTGPIRARASWNGFKGSSRLTAMPPGEVDLQVDLHSARDITVIVHEGGTAKPIAGARAMVSEILWPGQPQWSSLNLVPGIRHPNLEFALTDVDGRTVVAGLYSSAQYRVRVSAPGYRANRFHRRMIHYVSQKLPRDAREIRFELTPLGFRTGRWPIEAGEVPIPASGSKLSVTPRYYDANQCGREFPGVGRVENGVLVVQGIPDGIFSGQAVAEDEARCGLWLNEGQTEGRPIRLERARRLKVQVVDHEQHPVPGMLLSVRGQGGQSEARHVPTDSNGEVIFEGLGPRRVEIYLQRPGRAGLGTVVGTVEMQEGDQELRIPLPTELKLWIQPRIAGVPRLPAVYQVWIDGSLANIQQEHPGRGVCVVSTDHVAVGNTGVIVVRAEGFTTGKAHFTAEDLREAHPVVVELEPAVNLQVLVSRNEGLRLELNLEEWRSSTREWRIHNTIPNNLHRPNGPDGSFLFEGLQRGTYRVRDTQSGLSTERIEVDPLRGDSSIHLDLRVLRNLSGRLEAPEGFALSDARVTVQATDIQVGEITSEWSRGDPGGIRVGSDGRFRLLIPTDREVVVAVHHPFLVPSNEGGTARVAPGQEEVELELVESHRARLSVPAEVEPYVSRNTGFHILLSPAGAPSEPVFDTRTAWHEGAASFGGYEPGTYRMWIEAPALYAPLILDEVRLDEGVTDLGELPFDKGSSIRVRLKLPEGQDPPRLGVFAQRNGSPWYHRQMNSRGEQEVVLSGFGPGVFDVRVSTVMGSRQLFHGKLEFDGQADQILDLSLE